MIYKFFMYFGNIFCTNNRNHLQIATGSRHCLVYRQTSPKVNRETVCHHHHLISELLIDQQLNFLLNKAQRAWLYRPTYFC